MMDVNRRFGGLDRLYGVSGARVRAAHVAVVGIGGGILGSGALPQWYHELTLIDLDHVKVNVSGNSCARSDDGSAKVLAMRDRIVQINPDCHVTCIEEFVGRALANVASGCIR